MLCRLAVQVIINYLVDQAEKRATTSRTKADQVLNAPVEEFVPVLSMNRLQTQGGQCVQQEWHMCKRLCRKSLHSTKVMTDHAGVQVSTGRRRSHVLTTACIRKVIFL